MPAISASHRLIVATATIATVIGLAGCGGSPAQDAATTTPAASTSSSPTPTTAPAAPASSPAAGLSKADFVAQTDAECATILATIKAVPPLTSLTDYDGVIKYATLTLTDAPPFYDKVAALVAQSPDQAELTTKWIDPEQAYLTTTKPLYQQLIAAARAKDEAEVGRVSNELDAVTNPGADVSAFLQSYGLASCAELETP